MSTKVKEATPVSEPRLQIRLRYVALFLVLVGIIITSYLSYSKAVEVPVICTVGGAFNCEIVTNSSYSRFMGIPIAYLGLAMYLTMGALLLLENRVKFLQEYGVTVQFGLGLFAWLYSMYLVYLQFFVLQALCAWCLSHETTMTILFAVLCVRLYNSLKSA